jgi:nucleotide-binding universal stress UspA family protein
MKKIIAAFDGLKYSASTTDYAIHIAQRDNAHLVGIFLDDLIYHSYRFSDLLSDKGAVSYKKMQELNAKDTATRNQAIEQFSKACKQAKLQFSVHHDRNVAVQDLLHESVYSDLLIVNKKESFTIYTEKFPSDFITEILADVQCPVIVVPEKHKAPQCVVLLYDGDPSSVYAVKMFSYMFSAFNELPTKVLSVKPTKQSANLPDNRLMKEFMKRHFPKTEYIILRGNAEEKILAYLQLLNEEALVVLGAYRRNRVSRWFKTSMADLLMLNTKFPLFIAHNK